LLAAFPVVAMIASPVACGSDATQNSNYGSPPDASTFDPGQGTGSGGSYGYGDGAGGPSSPPEEAGPPQCADSDKLCAETFTYPYGGEQSVELRGSYNATAWTMGDPMTHDGKVWTVTVSVPWGQPVQYKFFVNGTTWVTDPKNPPPTDDGDADPDGNSIEAAITCPNTYTCASPPVPPAGVFDWRDAVIYFAFVDRFENAEKSNDCNVPGTTPNSTTSTNYLGGDWAGVTEKINDGYFTDLGVNTIWLTVPIHNEDDMLGAGVACNGGSCSLDSYEYSAYHGYWPSDPTTTEPCYGTPAELTALVQAAHKKNIKMLFDYAMVDVHTSSALYQQYQSQGWFTPFCQCGDTNNGCSDYDDYKCWFAPYLAHYDFTNSSAARTYSVNAALKLIQTYGNDAFRLDAIKQVDPSWLGSLRPLVTSQVLAKESPMQRFYMVGEAVLMRDPVNMLTPDDLNYGRTAPPGMTGLQQFMDSNDTFYPVDAVMSTFLGNHDLPRSIHYCEQTVPSWLGDDTSASSSNGQSNAWSGQPSLETDPNTYERLANGFAVILTNKGAPLIYYGDEYGMPGAGDPDNRRPMMWTGLSSSQTGLHDRIAALTAIRAAHPSMRRGTRTTLEVSQYFWVYQMSTVAGDPDPDTTYVAINVGDTDLTTSSLPSGLQELITKTPEGPSPVTIPARQARIFH
jgi:glycosidase